MEQHKTMTIAQARDLDEEARLTRTQRDEALQQLNKLQDQLEQCEAANASLEDQCRAAIVRENEEAEAREQAEERITQLEQVVEDMRDALAHANADLEALEEERNELESKGKLDARGLEEAQQEHAIVAQLQKQQLIEAREALGAAESELVELREQIVVQKEQLGAYESGGGIASKELESERRLHEQCRQRVHTLDAELSNAKLDLEVAQQDVEKATKATADLERVLRQFQEDRETQVTSALRA